VKAIHRLEAIVRGSVQGVGFRWFVRGNALRFELTGWVANQQDGSVRVVAEGSRDALESLLSQLHLGPSGAVVSSVDETWLPASGSFAGFDIRMGSHSGD
jgi:acylphosphatase